MIPSTPRPALFVPQARGARGSGESWARPRAASDPAALRPPVPSSREAEAISTVRDRPAAWLASTTPPRRGALARRFAIDLIDPQERPRHRGVPDVRRPLARAHRTSATLAARAHRATAERRRAVPQAARRTRSLLTGWFGAASAAAARRSSRSQIQSRPRSLNQSTHQSSHQSRDRKGAVLRPRQPTTSLAPRTGVRTRRL